MLNNWFKLLWLWDNSCRAYLLLLMDLLGDRFYLFVNCWDSFLYDMDILLGIGGELLIYFGGLWDSSFFYVISSVIIVRIWISVIVIVVRWYIIILFYRISISRWVASIWNRCGFNSIRFWQFIDNCRSHTITYCCKWFHICWDVSLLFEIIYIIYYFRFI